MSRGSSRPTSLAGVDGCRAGWVVVVARLVDGQFAEPSAVVVPTFRDVLDRTTDCRAVAVDIPIGLLESAQPGGRAVDREARKLLSPNASSVFSPPPRPALGARSYDEARNAVAQVSDGRSLSRQAFGILPKIAEVDRLMTSELQGRVFETHPELCFSEMNGGRPLEHRKSTAAGALGRIRLLDGYGLAGVLSTAAAMIGNDAKLDDVLDAVAALWTARRYAEGKAIVIPDITEVDAKGLRMEMWR